MEFLSEQELLNYDICETIKFGENLPNFVQLDETYEYYPLIVSNWKKFNSSVESLSSPTEKIYLPIEYIEYFIKNKNDANYSLRFFLELIFRLRIFDKEPHEIHSLDSAESTSISDLVYKVNKDNKILIDLISSTDLPHNVENLLAHYKKALVRWSDKFYENSRDDLTCTVLIKMFNNLIKNKAKFGVLTSLRHSWFFKIGIKEGKYVLFMSDRVESRDFLRSFRWLIELAKRETIRLDEPMEVEQGVGSSAEEEQGDEEEETYNQDESQEFEMKNFKNEIEKSLQSDKYEFISESKFGVVNKIRLGDGFAAVKVCDLNKMAECKKYLQNEARIYRHLNKRNVACVPKLIYDGIIEGMLYVVAMEFIEGTRLDQVVADPTVVKNCAAALYEIHRAGVKHGNIQEKNVMITDYKKIYFTDFTQSEIVDPNDQRNFTDDLQQLKDILLTNQGEKP